MANEAGPAAQKTIPVNELKPLLPDVAGAWRRTAIDVDLPRGSLVQTSVVRARYADRKQQVLLTVSDWGVLAGAPWPATAHEREVDGGKEKSYVQDRRLVRELAVPRGRSELTVTLANGVVVQASGDKVELASLKALVDALDLSRIEALKRPDR